MSRQYWLLQPRLHVTLTCLLTFVGGCSSPPPRQSMQSGQVVPPVSTLAVNPTLDEPSAPSTAVPAVVTPTTMTALGEEVALRAIALVGKPYRYGGADLEGFDCSGLVYFIHQALGFSVPRTAAQQQQAAAHIRKTDLQPGDLLFFRTTSTKRISHVGVYVGENRFVHAPQSGKLIELRTIDDQYYGPRLVSLGRLHPAS